MREENEGFMVVPDSFMAEVEKDQIWGQVRNFESCLKKRMRQRSGRALT
jgi:hypothetical protein